MSGPGTAPITGGDAVVQSLIDAGVEVVFGMPGVDNLPIYDALARRRLELRHVLVRHEQGAGFMADGYARATRRVGVCLTTTGPGALNAATAMAAAHADGSPVLLIASQADSQLMGRGKGPSHDMRDQRGVFRSIASWARTVTRTRDIPLAVHAALRATCGPRPGPAYLELPADVLAAEETLTFPSWQPRRLPRVDAGALAKAAAWLGESQRPVLLCGGGVRWSQASAEVEMLAERLGAPVLTTTGGKGALPEPHPLSAGVIWGRWSLAAQLLAESDLVLAIGTRLGAMDTQRWRLPMPGRRIHLDIDAGEINRNYADFLPLIGDARATLRRLAELIGPGENRQAWLDVAACREQALDPVRDRPELELLRTLASALPPDVLLANDGPTLGYWMTAYWQAPTADSFMTAAFGSLGFGLPAALGARLGHPSRPILALCGDGGLLFSGQELATAVHEQLPLVILVVNDDSYGSVRIIQEQQYHGRTSQVSVTNPDFVAFAHSFGAAATRVEQRGELPDALMAAFAARRPYLVELRARCGLPPLA